MPTSGRSAAPPRSLTLLLYTFAGIAALLWVLALTAPHNAAFPPGPGFLDITVYKGRFTLYHTARFFSSRAYSGFAYPAGAAVIYEAFYKTSDPKSAFFLLAAVLLAISAAVGLWMLSRARALSLALPLALATAFPMTFLLERANIELVLWFLVAAGIFLAWRGLAIPAAILFGLGFAIKLYPVLLLGLFLRRRRDLPAFLTGIATAILAMIFAIAHAGPTFGMAAQGFFTGVDRFQTHYVDTVSRVEVVFDHCLFSPFKYLALLHHVSPAPWRTAYYLIAGSVAVVLFVRVRTLPFLNRVLFLTAAMVALPPVSFSYTLTHLELPLLLLVIALTGAKKRAPLTAWLALVLLLTLMLPLPALTAAGVAAPGPLASLALAVLLGVTVLQPWPSATRADAA